jgi:hypothetical protein
MKTKIKHYIHRLKWTYYSVVIDIILKAEKRCVRRKDHEGFAYWNKMFDKCMDRRFEMLKERFWKIES